MCSGGGNGRQVSYKSMSTFKPWTIKLPLEGEANFIVFQVMDNFFFLPKLNHIYLQNYSTYFFLF